jgi:hypothetical protein
LETQTENREYVEQQMAWHTKGAETDCQANCCMPTRIRAKKCLNYA